MPAFEDLNPQAQLLLLKRRISSFKTNFNVKLKGGSELAKQVIGPPALHSPIIEEQLRQCLADLEEPYGKLKTILDLIISRVEGDDDPKEFDHYVKYMADLTTEFDDCKSFIAIALSTTINKTEDPSVPAAEIG